ncbi:MAG: hypothetical protein JW797_19815 [Bradymonadales bacterium]|nr:hypothetical protein [Bradymonadales bacterium]
MKQGGTELRSAALQASSLAGAEGVSGAFLLADRDCSLGPATRHRSAWSRRRLLRWFGGSFLGVAAMLVAPIGWIGGRLPVPERMRFQVPFRPFHRGELYRPHDLAG